MAEKKKELWQNNRGSMNYVAVSSGYLQKAGLLDNHHRSNRLCQNLRSLLDNQDHKIEHDLSML